MTKVKIFLVILVLALPLILYFGYSKYKTSRIQHNEDTIYLFLCYHLRSAQAKFGHNKYVNQDQDITGEFGFLKELTGYQACRGSGIKITPPITKFSSEKPFPNLTITEQGFPKYSGYYLTVYLPANKDFTEVMSEIDIKAVTDKDTIDSQEMYFIWYAWPIEWGKTGCKVFALSYSYDFRYTENKDGRYSGSQKPNFDAAFGENQCLVKYGAKGRDGNIWKASY